MNNIKQVLRQHKLWLRDHSKGRRVDRYGTDLRGADLCGVELREANLREANLRGADLREADLRGANLRGANLRKAILREADLRKAILCGADLRGVDLREVNLREANLRGADLRGADLRGADITNIKVSAYSICPETGSFIAYKKLDGNLIGTFQIPKTARRMNSLVGRKIRVDKAKLIRVETMGGNLVSSNIFRTWNHDYYYSLNKLAIPDKYDDDIRIECTYGIHVFLTKQEAIDLE